MAKKMLFILIPLLVSAALLPAYGQMVANGPLNEEAILAIIAASPSESERPDLDALVLFEGVFIDQENGLVSIRTQRLTRLYTELAIDELGDPRLAYDKNRQEFILHASRTYLPDGTTLDTPDMDSDGYTGVNDVTPDVLDLAVDHISIREVVVTRVGLVREAVVLLDYTIQETAPGDLPFNHLHFFSGDHFALRKVLEVDADLFQEMVNPPYGIYKAPTVADVGGKFVWRLQDVPAMPRNRHRLGDQIPWVAISSEKSWESILTDCSIKMKQAADEESTRLPILEKMEEEKPFLGPRTKLEAWMKMIEDRTELIDYNPWVYTPAPRTVDATLNSSYATPAERCAILLACCLEQGWQPYVYFAPRWKTLTERVPALEALGHTYVRVSDLHNLDETLFLDAFSGEITRRIPFNWEAPVFRGSMIGSTVAYLSIVTLVGRYTEVRRPDRIDISLYWNVDSGVGVAEGVLLGPAYWNYGQIDPSEVIHNWAVGWMDGMEASVPFLQMNEDYVHFTLDMKAPLPEPDARGRIALQLPIAPVGISDLLPTGFAREQSSIDGVLFHDSPVDVHINWKIDLPEDATLLPGEGKESTWKDARFKVERTENGERVEIDYTLKLDGAPVTPADYAEYRAFVADLLDERLTRIVLVPDEEE